jgi:biotin carboxyl carrier protein
MGVLKRACWSLCGVSSGLTLAIALGTAGAVVSAGVPEPGSGQTYVGKSARTRFILTRKLSADRLGVLKMTPEEGEYVTANSIVAKLQDEVPEAAVASAAAKAQSDAEILAADKLAESEHLEFELMKEANKNAVASSRPTYPLSDVRRAELRAAAADLQTGVKRHEKNLASLELSQAQAELKTYHLVTPIDGVVTNVFKRSGEGVQQGESILEIVNTSIIRVEDRIPAAIAARVQVGAPVKVRFKISEAPEKGPPPPRVEVEGRIGFVDVSAEPQAQVVRVWAEIANPKQLLRAGIPAEMEITLDASPAGLDDSNLQSVPEASSRAGSKPAN